MRPQVTPAPRQGPLGAQSTDRADDDELLELLGTAKDVHGVRGQSGRSRCVPEQDTSSHPTRGNHAELGEWQYRSRTHTTASGGFDRVERDVPP